MKNSPTDAKALQQQVSCSLWNGPWGSRFSPAGPGDHFWADTPWQPMPEQMVNAPCRKLQCITSPCKARAPSRTASLGEGGRGVGDKFSCRTRAHTGAVPSPTLWKGPHRWKRKAWRGRSSSDCPSLACAARKEAEGLGLGSSEVEPGKKVGVEYIKSIFPRLSLFYWWW